MAGEDGDESLQRVGVAADESDDDDGSRVGSEHLPASSVSSSSPDVASTPSLPVSSSLLSLSACVSHLGE